MRSWDNEMTSYIQHPCLKENAIERRMFQLELASNALQDSTLVVLPTGLGKTIIALLVMLARHDQGKVLFMAPTKPLVEQHASFLRNVLTDDSWVVQFTGENPPEHRINLWQEAKVVVSTPQVIENDLLSRRINLRDVSCIIFDEAHRGIGNYAYVYIAKRYLREGRNQLVLGITASPGSSAEKIEEVCSNLGITKVETRTENDPDVAPFVHKKEIEVVKVSVPQAILNLRNLLKEVLEDRIEVLGRFDLMVGRSSKWLHHASKKELLNIQKMLRSSITKNPSPDLYQAVSVLAEVMKLKHAVELAETQGVDSLAKYMERLDMEAQSRGGSKAARRIIEDPRVQEAIYTLERLDVDHPKLLAVRDLVKEQFWSEEDSRIMVFTNYRDTASSVLEFLEETGDEIIKPVRFVGQSNRVADEGLTQKQQAEILRQFREGEYNVLIATSVGEEGIDIPATDLVIFYEPVPSEIRSIQRKGRTGRARAGKVVVLVAKGTKDEAYRWISNRKERDMQKQIREMSWPEKKEFTRAARQLQIGELHLSGSEISSSFRPEEDEASALVAVDPRERGMAKRLESLGIGVVLKVLEIGDYVISDQIAIERKTAADFVDSLVDPERGLFRQISDLARNYEKPVLILEGQDLYTRQVHPNAIRGALASIAVDFGVPIIPTENEDETVSVIALMARREQEERTSAPDVHGKKTHRTLNEQQEYLVSSIPSVGPTMARNLLKHFGSVEKVLTASEEELKNVDLVGPKTAERIREVVGEKYKG
ncbi:MAG: DEAD/DEAH box helicase [Methanotrichaceae archaeon]